MLDLWRARARWHNRGKSGLLPPSDKLHLGCGRRKVPGWLNIDVRGSDHDVDLGCGCLPWADDVFETVISQQVIEHLDLFEELIPLLRELKRTARNGAEIWLCCPDLEKACRSYDLDRGKSLYNDARTRSGIVMEDGTPTQYYINDLFVQDGAHKNLFDLELLTWTLDQAGLSDAVRTSESELLAAFPDFPKRGDDYQAIYVKVTVQK